MARKLAKKILGGFIYGVVACGVFIIVIWVSAVAPGTVQTPTFGPTDDDVFIDADIACNWTGLYAQGGSPNGLTGDRYVGIGDYGHNHYYSLGARCEGNRITEMKWFHVYYGS